MWTYLGSLTGFFILLSYVGTVLPTVQPTAHILCVPRNILTVLLPLFPYLLILTVQQFRHSEELWCTAGKCQSGCLTDQQADTVKHSEGKVQKLYLFLSLTLLLHRAVIVNYSGAIKLPWLVCWYVVIVLLIKSQF